MYFQKYLFPSLLPLGSYLYREDQDDKTLTSIQDQSL